MNYAENIVFIALISFACGESTSQTCNNGVFKCTSQTTLQICFQGKLVSSEFSCPSSTFCCESSSTICTQLLTPSCITGNETATTDFSNNETTEYQDTVTKATSTSEEISDQDGSSSIIETTTTEDVVTLTTPGLPICTTREKIPMPNTECKKYIMCSSTTTGFEAKEMDCYAGSLFDPGLKRCSRTYICTENIEPGTTVDPEDSNSTIPVCAGREKHPMPNTECQKYFSCTSAGGEPTEMDCYAGSLFDPGLKRCSRTYICTENIEPGTTDEPEDSNSTIPVCTGREKHPMPNTECKKYYSCTSAGGEPTEMDCYAGSLFDPAVKRCSRTYTCAELGNGTEEGEPVTKPPICVGRDKTPILNTECKRYYMCTSPGKAPKEMNCYEGSLFDPETKLCSKTYVCTEGLTTEDTTTNQDETTTLFDEAITSTTSFDEVTTSTTPDEPLCDTEDPTTHSTEYVKDDTISDVSTVGTTQTTSKTENLACTEEGKIAIPNTNCKKFKTCILYTSGLEYQESECPNGYLFDPKLNKCTTTYVCSESNPLKETSTNSVRTDSSNEIQICSDQGKFPIPDTSCTKYLLCVRTTSGFRSKEYECPSGAKFNPELKMCSKVYVCPETTTEDASTTTVSEATTSELPAICEEQGKFPIPDSECKGYRLCVKTTTGFRHKEYICPVGYLFNPQTQRCSNSYICKDTTTTTPTIVTSTPTQTTTFSSTTPPPTTTTTPDISTPSSTHLPEIFECVEQGKFPAPNSNCNEYYLCVLTTTGFRVKQYKCPSGYSFDPIAKRCSNSYICGDFTTTPIEITTLTTTTTGVFVCKEQGKFPSNSDCTVYTICVLTSNGFISKEYKCPNGYAFDPVNKRCSNSYTCSEETTTPVTDTTTSLTTTTQATETTTEVTMPQCTQQGKLPVPGTGCRKYLLCIWTKKGFVSAMYSCPSETYFNPSNSRCSKNYICTENQIAKRSKTIFRCPTIGKFPDLQAPGCTYYYKCTVTQDNTLKAILQQCKKGYSFNPELQKCSADYFCYKHIQRRNTKLAKSQVEPRFLVNGRCTTVGRYLVSGSQCKNYTLCQANVDGSLKATNFVCPTTSVFNQAIQKCTASFTCPDSVCFMPGQVPNPNDKTCGSFITCNPNFDPNTGIITSYTGMVDYCPAGMNFNPFMMGCDQFYVCPK